MALTTSFAYTNKTAGTDMASVAIGIHSNYAKVVEKQEGSVTMANKTTPLDQGELISYRCRGIDRINTSQIVQHPAPVQSGLEWGVKMEEILRTKDADGNIVFDEPIKVTLTFQNPKSNNITDAVITEVFSRLLGACYDKTASKYRWSEIMRSALEPAED